MRAVVLYQTGDPEVLQYREDIPEPQLQPDEVLVRVRATSLNRVDIVIRRSYLRSGAAVAAHSRRGYCRRDCRVR
jgi:NADPH:quinone reductase-like Zn-dependent oxidoreductase